MTSDDPAAQRQIRPVGAADPRTVGAYTVVGRLGVGGMGVVYLAHAQDSTRVALKVVHSSFADQPQFRARFSREVAAARAVGGQYTARVVDADTDASPQWIATEYVPGPTLAQHIATQGAMPEGQVRLLGLGLAEAVEAIHAAGLIHRDLKPSNVILSPDGPKVIDFGISQTTDDTSLTQTGAFVGSLPWMSPEQLTGTTTTDRTDLFSMGLLLAYATLGRHPYGEGRPEAVAFRMVNQAPALGDVSPSLRRVCQQLLSSVPEERPTPEAVVSALTDGTTAISGIATRMNASWDATVVADRPPAHHSPTPRRQDTQARPRRRRAALASVAGLSALAAGAALAVALGVTPPTFGSSTSDVAAPRSSATPEPATQPTTPNEQASTEQLLLSPTASSADMALTGPFVELTSRATALLADGSATPVAPGTPVEAQFQAAADDEWDIMARGEVGQDGLASVSVRPRAEGIWRLAVSGQPAEGVLVRHAGPTKDYRFTRADAAPEPVKAGDELTIVASAELLYTDGVVRPLPPRRTFWVQFRPQGATTWVNVSTDGKSTQGQLKATVRAYETGDWRFRIGPVKSESDTVIVL